MIEYRSLEDFRAIALRDTPQFEPGTQFRYSNTGFVVLGALIARASGEPWDRYLARHVFAPAKMASTSAYRPDSGMAVGYDKGESGAWVRNDSLLIGRGSPAGGGARRRRTWLPLQLRCGRGSC